MGSSYRKMFQEDPEIALARFVKDVFTGLQRSRKTLSSKYMYDDKGSEIYEQIMNLPEYYLVDAEYNSLENAKFELTNVMQGKTFNLIELGAGNGIKTKVLIRHLMENQIDFTYIPVDISESAMVGLIDALNNEFPSLTSNGLVAEYFDALETIKNQNSNRQNVVLFLGSNIGNFDFKEAVNFIFSLWTALKFGDYVLIGFDLRKNIEQMVNAYNDSQGITAKFNLNVLERINRELGANFDLSKFKHYEPYNIQSGAMESYLISLEDQEVYIDILKKSFTFEQWEPIFMEQSFKFTTKDIEKLANLTGFRIEGLFYDKNKWFANALWCVKK